MTLADATLRAPDRAMLLSRYGGRAPRYTSYPTAAQFTPAVDADVCGKWLSVLPTTKPVSLYVHIPFCARLCWYCACNTRAVHRRETISDYIGLVRDELALIEARLPARPVANALHLGGGTPNMLSRDDLTALFGAIRHVFDLQPGAEIAAEIDPSQLTRQWVQAAAFHGLTRASLGVQDLSPAVQAAVNRPEPFEVVARAAGWLREIGVRSLNLDLMYGLPRQTTADVLGTLDRVLTLEPERLALFGYAHVPWMKPHQKLIDAQALPGDLERIEQSEAAAERLKAAGYVRIGLDHYAREDDELALAAKSGRLHRNFQGYTVDEAETLIGIGASAIGRLPQGYVQNTAEELAWRKAVLAGVLPTARGVALTDDDRFRAEIIERLMCDLAVDLAAIAARRGRTTAELAPAIERLRLLEADGLVVVSADRLTVTEAGRPFMRAACAVFDAYLAPDAQRHSSVV
ncbi:MAG TPA: oxygen-independent coproporphyrinogen III oxidase [Caulobacteraceae bacterium]|nr:oxygen-independent coproporphyrinogen III oxidase [Caulobacteraceae bacterium]